MVDVVDGQRRAMGADGVVWGRRVVMKWAAQQWGHRLGDRNQQMWWKVSGYRPKMT